MARIQHGWVTPKSGAWLGHFRKNGKMAPAIRLGSQRDMTLTAAREKLRTILVQELGITGDGTMTLGGFVKSKWVPLHESQWRPSSRATVLGVLKMITTHFDGVALQDIDAVQLSTYLTTLAQTRSGSLVKMVRAYLRSIFAQAVEDDLLRKNPARLLRMPKHLKAVAHPYLSIAEIQTLLGVAMPFGVRTKDYALLRLFLCTGMRPGEVFALRWRNVEWTPGAATLTLESTIYKGVLRGYTKTTSEGHLPKLVLPEIAVETLIEWYETQNRPVPDAFIFPNADGGAQHPDNYLTRNLQPLAKLAGISKLTYQQLRRTFATHAQHSGSLKDVSELMRHKQLATTFEIYTQVLSESARAASERTAAKMLVKQ